MSDDSASKRLLQALGEQKRMGKTVSDAALPRAIQYLATRSEHDKVLQNVFRDVPPGMWEQAGNALAGRPPADLQKQLIQALNQFAGGSPFGSSNDMAKRLLAGVTLASPAAERRADRVRSASDLGALVRRARKSMSMNQAQFAAHAGVGRRFVSELESGKASLEFDRVMACAEAAGVDLVARIRGG